MQQHSVKNERGLFPFVKYLERERQSSAMAISV